MKIAIIGTRGIPPRYGGFETCAEKIALYLAEKGHRVFVTCRKYLYPDKPRRYKNIELSYPLSIKGKAADTFSHTFFSVFRAIIWNPDAILMFNAANSPLASIARIFRKKIIINVDGLEWKRKKWGFAGKTYFRFASFFATVIADYVVADSIEIARYYQSHFQKNPTYIPYGAEIFYSKNPEILSDFGLKPQCYFFTGSRLEPENNQDLMIREYNRLNSDIPFAIAGNTQNKSRYVKELKSKAKKGVKFIGNVYNAQMYSELQANSIAYIHGNEVGGTNPALLSAMGCGSLIIALDVPFNREVLGDCGLYFTKKYGSLSELIKQILEKPEKYRPLGEKARERARNLYRWEDVGKRYEELFLRFKNEKQKSVYFS
ncbi:MAG: DUF1972 domain-containing protein [Candidatus Omnitrophica bacterium]|nr:DUF1972 domain-containing protein [Candidatus Omnitrophota bacterium]